MGREGAIALTDADRAGQALDNLVANALAHGGGEVRVVGREVDERVELHVTDEGEGFPEAAPARFRTLQPGRSGRSGEGTGLGLAIVAAIARAHDGDVGARNLPGGGADVWISPAARANAPPPEGDGAGGVCSAGLQAIAGPRSLDRVDAEGAVHLLAQVADVHVDDVRAVLVPRVPGASRSWYRESTSPG